MHELLLSDMKSQRIRMTIDEYLQMQQPFGYKVEYINGEAIFQPRELHIDARLRVTHRHISSVWNFVSVETGLLQSMQEAFFAAFHDSIEFCDWPEHAIRKHAGKHIADYFAGVRGDPHPVSTALLDQDGGVIALALFLTGRESEVKLDLLFVLPDFQRQGMATDMVVTAVNQLHQQGVTEVFSAYHALNQASQDWHHAFGFEDVYDQYYVRMKYGWYRREIHRLRALGVTGELEALQQAQDYWYGLLEDEWKSGF